MKEDRPKTKKTKNGFGTFTKIWAVLYLLVTAAFAGVLIYMNLLPAKYLYMAGGVIAAVLLLTFPALFFRNFKKSRKIMALVLSVLIMGVYGGGMVYMGGTMEFFSNITKVGATTEEYYVIAKADSKYSDVESIKNKTVYTYLNHETGYAEARNMLRDEAGVQYEMVENLSDLAEGLGAGSFDGAADEAKADGTAETAVPETTDETTDGTESTDGAEGAAKDVELIFVSEGHYTAICSENKGFKDKVKIVHTIKVARQAENVAKNVDVTNKPFNVYVSGLDIQGPIDTVSRSDVNMIVTVNPKTHKVLLTSLPRDSYVKLPGKGGVMDKLTHTGLYGIEETIAAAEELMGIDINYYVKVNYTTVTQLVDAIGGVNVNSDYTFTTHGMGVYYEFYEGDNYLDGSRALAFARERKSFSDGDFQRNRNQQLVLEAVLKKALSSKTILTKYTSILNAMEDSVEINMPQKDMQKLIKMQLSGMPSWDFERQSILGEIGSELCYSTGDFYTSIIYPDEKSVIEAVDKIVAVME